MKNDSALKDLSVVIDTESSIISSSPTYRANQLLAQTSDLKEISPDESGAELIDAAVGPGEQLVNSATNAAYLNMGVIAYG